MQKDVTEVARAFTGWTIDNPRGGGGFRFAPRFHDDGAKLVLGMTATSTQRLAWGIQQCLRFVRFVTSS